MRRSTFVHGLLPSFCRPSPQTEGARAIVSAAYRAAVMHTWATMGYSSELDIIGIGHHSPSGSMYIDASHARYVLNRTLRSNTKLRAQRRFCIQNVYTARHAMTRETNGGHLETSAATRASRSTLPSQRWLEITITFSTLRARSNPQSRSLARPKSCAQRDHLFSLRELCSSVCELLAKLGFGP